METREAVKNIFEESLSAKKEFASDDLKLENVAEAIRAIVECYERGGKVIIFGNGGAPRTVNTWPRNLS